MRRRSALRWALFALLVAAALSQDADPCKRQPFRGRCPASGAGQPQRSQFVLRYYLRNGECVSYPYGHCANDENEPKLFRYKEECEDACIGNPREEVATTAAGGQTYATLSPDEQTTVGSARAGAAEQSECQKQREQRGSARIHGGFVPECTADGKFRPLQCEPDGRSCFCVSTDGIEIPNSRATVPEQPKPNCDQIEQNRPLTTKEPQASAESDSCLGGASPLEGPDGRPIDCARTDCPVGFKCSVGAHRSICCKDDQKTSGGGELHSGVAPQFCSKPKERGPCDRYELRFYYQPDLKECKYFFYGGCEGNENNFPTIDDCKRTCGAGPATKATPAATRPTSPRPSPVEAAPTTSSVVETSRTETTAVWTTAGSTPPEAEDVETTSAAANLPTERDTTADETTSTARTEEVSQTTQQSLERFTASPSESTTAEDAFMSVNGAPTTAESSSSNESRQQPIDGGQEQIEGDREQTEEEQEQTKPWRKQTEAPTRAQEETAPTSQSTEFPENFEQETTERARTNAQTLPPPPPPAPLPRQRPGLQQPQPQTRPTTQRATTTTTTAAPLPEDRCDHPKDSGSCGGRFDRWYWNAEKRICEAFSYSGCGGNGNNWGTREECLGSCGVKATTAAAAAPAASSMSPNVCEHSIDEGECGGSFARFGFDRDVGECREFTYTGCGGNGLPPIPSDCPPLDVNRCVEPCIIFSNRLGCQECVCPVQPPTRPNLPPRSEAPVPPAGGVDTPRLPQRPAAPSPPAAPGTGLPPSPERMPKKRPDLPVVHHQPNVEPKPDEVPAPPPAEPQFPNLGEKCTQHVDPGPCTNFVERWHFNPARGECEPFQYGGCAGNRNHFYTANECNLHCARFRVPSSNEAAAPQPVQQEQQEEAGSSVSSHASNEFISLPTGEERQQPFVRPSAPVPRVEQPIAPIPQRPVWQQPAVQQPTAQQPTGGFQQQPSSGFQRQTNSTIAQQEPNVPHIRQEVTREFPQQPNGGFPQRPTAEFPQQPAVQQPNAQQPTAFAPPPSVAPTPRAPPPRPQIQQNFVPVEPSERPQLPPQQPRQTVAPPPQNPWRTAPQEPQPPAPHRPSPPPTPTEQPQKEDFELIDVPPQHPEAPFVPEPTPFNPRGPIGRQPPPVPLPTRNPGRKPFESTFAVAPNAPNAAPSAPSAFAPPRFAQQTAPPPPHFAPAQGSRQFHDGRAFVPEQPATVQPAQQPQQRVFQIDQDVRQEPDLFNVEGEVANPNRRDPQPAPQLPTERQFVAQRPIQQFVTADGEVIGAVRDATHVDNVADSPPGFGPKQTVPAGAQREQRIDNPWAGNQPHSPPQQQHQQQQQQGPPNVNARYIPPNPPVRPEPVYQPPVQPPPPAQPFNINQQYIPPAPATVAPLAGEAAGVSPTPARPAIISRPESNTYPPNVEPHYPGRRREPLPAPRLDLGIPSQAIARPHQPAVSFETRQPLPVASTPSTTTTTTRAPGPASVSFIPLEEDEVETTDEEDRVETSPSTVPSTSASTTPSAAPSTRPVPSTPGIKPEEPTARPFATRLPIRPLRREFELPHSVALPVHEDEAEAQSAESQPLAELPTATSKSDVHSVDLPAIDEKNATESAEEVEPKASAAKTQFVKDEEKLALAKIDKTTASVEVSGSTEKIAEPTTSSVEITSPSTAPSTSSATSPSTNPSTAPSTTSETTKKAEETTVQSTTTAAPSSSSATAASSSALPSSAASSTSTGVPATTPKTSSAAPSTTASSTSSSSTTSAPNSTTSSSTAQSSSPTSSPAGSRPTSTNPPTSASTLPPTTAEKRTTVAVATEFHADTEGEISVAAPDDADLLVDPAAGSIGTTTTNTSAAAAAAPPPPPPARVNSARTEEIAHPPSASHVNKAAAKIDADDSQPPTYNAQPLPKEQPNVEHLPIISPSPKATIDYAAGKRLDNGPKEREPIFGLPNAPGDKKENIVDLEGKGFEEVQKIPVCPNGLKAMHYSDGRPIMCLPGKNQCPDSSVCYFNGLDFYCCPNEEDPYDQHVFGGYDGEEVKHGYKNKTETLSIRSTNTLAERRARHRREAPVAAETLDHVSNSLRFDDARPPHRISQAARINPCTQPAPQADECESKHLRYFYDIDNDDCRVLLGCDGAGENQFLTKEQCEKRCKLGPILSARPPTTTSTTEKPTPAGHCPGGKTPLGDNAPVLCGNQTDSIGCPPGYFCRFGPPDVCCPDDVKFDLGRVLSTPRADIRRKPFVASGDKSIDSPHGPDGEQSPAQLFIDDAAAFDISAGAPGATPSEESTTSTAAPTTTSEQPWEFLTPPNMCPDGSDALTNSAGEAMVCGSGFDGHKLCPRGFYCSIDRERNSRLCCKLDIQSSNIPNPAPQIAPYLGVRRANPGEAIDRPSLPSDQRFAFRRAHRVL
ncbi:Thyroglobulin type-1 and Proteinase inhibitor I2 domain containing protein [Aphelenchoides fujianensis]|nr:Thyroglobulin type-1 and Proteinase inhibitor I2 domain containing protein [Aphelenchoides fujianensis]